MVLHTLMKPNEKVIEFENFRISGTKEKVTFKTSIGDFRKKDDDRIVAKGTCL